MWPRRCYGWSYDTTSSHRGATTVRTSKNEIRARTRDLPITFSEERISSHGGLELVRRFFDLIDFHSRVRDGMRGPERDGDYGFTRTLLSVIRLLIVGGARVTHLAFLAIDPVFLRFCGLHRLPADRTVVAWLKGSLRRRSRHFARSFVISFTSRSSGWVCDV